MLEVQSTSATIMHATAELGVCVRLHTLELGQSEGMMPTLSGRFGPSLPFLIWPLVRVFQIPGNIGHYLTVYLTPTVFKQKEVLANFDAFIKGAPNTTNCAAALPCGAPVNPIHWVDLSDTVVDGMTSPPLAMQGAGKLGGLFKVANKYRVPMLKHTKHRVLSPVTHMTVLARGSGRVSVLAHSRARRRQKRGRIRSHGFFF